MRILQINKHHYIKGGADRVYFNTGNLLAENGHEVLYFSTSHQENFESRYSGYFVPFVENRLNGFFYNAYNSGSYLYNRAAYKNLTRLIEDHKPDVAHLHLIYGELSASVLKVLKNQKVPVVQTVHDYRLLCPANALLDSHNRICEKCRNKSFYQCTIYRCLEGNLYYSAILSAEAYIRKYFIDPVSYINRFIFVSRFSKNKHTEFDSRFASRSVHLYNFTDTQYGYKNSDRGGYFLFYGRLSKEKGLVTLLNVADRTRVNLKVAGRGPLEDEVMSRASRNSNIEYLGYKGGEDLKKIISGASFVIVPSEWYENNPMTVLEAYSFGVPVIGAKIGGIPEIIIDGKTGFLFNSRDESDLERVILKVGQLNQQAFNELSVNAGKFAEQNFSSKIHYQQLMEVYNDVLKNA